VEYPAFRALAVGMAIATFCQKNLLWLVSKHTARYKCSPWFERIMALLALTSSHENPAMQALIAKFAATLRREIQQDHTLDELEAMTLALLEEIKINYVKRLSQEDYDILLEQRFRLYDMTQQRAQ